jgi:hypothetical protein
MVTVEEPVVGTAVRVAGGAGDTFSDFDEDPAW